MSSTLYVWLDGRWAGDEAEQSNCRNQLLGRQMLIHSSCSGVSGMFSPRAALTSAIAFSTPIPDMTSKAAATKPERPMPWRQWTATF
jgi:hypothetical protein